MQRVVVVAWHGMACLPEQLIREQWPAEMKKRDGDEVDFVFLLSSL